MKIGLMKISQNQSLCLVRQIQSEKDNTTFSRKPSSLLELNWKCFLLLLSNYFSWRTPKILPVVPKFAKFRKKESKSERQAFNFKIKQVFRLEMESQTVSLCKNCLQKMQQGSRLDSLALILCTRKKIVSFNF